MKYYIEISIDYLIMTKNLFHVKQIYLTDYVVSSYLAYSPMYDKKSSICKCNVCISITWCMYCLGEKEKGQSYFKSTRKNRNGKRKTFLYWRTFKNSIDWNLNDKSVMFHYCKWWVILILLSSHFQFWKIFLGSTFWLLKNFHWNYMSWYK